MSAQDQQLLAQEEKPDFYGVEWLSQKTGFSVGAIYNQSSAKRGPFGKLLRRVGGKLLISRRDYEAWLNNQSNAA